MIPWMWGSAVPASFLLRLKTCAQAHPASLNSLHGEELDVPAWTKQHKNLVSIRDVHLLMIKGSRLGALSLFTDSLSSLFLFLCLQPQFQRVYAAGSTQDLLTGSIFFFLPLISLSKAQLSYSTSQFCCVKVSWGLWASTFWWVCCENWELNEVCCTMLRAW